MEIDLPADLRREVDELVAMGEFPDAPAAVVALVRVGLGYRYRRPRGASPSLPRDLPAERRPGLPGDVNWIPPEDPTEGP